MIGYREWLNLRESLEKSIKCPHPDDKEFCRQWNLYIKGKGDMPIYKKRPSLGHYKGLKSRKMDSKKNKLTASKGKKGSKNDWRRDIE